jgi:hypothetical protein
MIRAISLFSAVVLASVASTAQAQIVFQTPVAITTNDGSQILTNGSYVDAVGGNGFWRSPSMTFPDPGAAITIGSTTFNPIFSDSGITFSSPTGIDGGSDGSYSDETPFLTVLDGVAYVGDFNVDDVQTGTVTLHNLVAGDQYQVQVFNDGFDKTLLHGTSSTNQEQVYFAYSVGDFTAGSSGTQTFTFDSSVSGIGAIDAIVLEQIPEPSTWTMMLGGLALFGFCVRRKLA